MRIRQD